MRIIIFDTLTRFPLHFAPRQFTPEILQKNFSEIEGTMWLIFRGVKCHGKNVVLSVNKRNCHEYLEVVSLKVFTNT